jgi:hypothetical protein
VRTINLPFQVVFLSQQFIDNFWINVNYLGFQRPDQQLAFFGLENDLVSLLNPASSLIFLGIIKTPFFLTLITSPKSFHLFGKVILK